MVLTGQFLVAVAGKGSDALFFPLVFLHVVAALAGFGSVGFAGTYASRAAHVALAAGPQQEAPPSTAGQAEGAHAEITVPGTPAVDPEAEELLRYFQKPARFWKALPAVPLFGVLAVAADPSGGGLDQVWVIGALIIWLCATLVALSMVVPALREMRVVLLRSAASPSGPSIGGSDRSRLVRAGALASRGAVLCDLLFCAALALMIWQP